MPSTGRSRAVVPVAVGVLRDARGRVLLARRPAGTYQAGKWEFPGGRIDAAEEALGALRRELNEELGVTMLEARPLIRLEHDYADRRVLLDVWRVLRHRGEPRGREGQLVRWVALEDLEHYDLLEANRAIVRALQLPPLYLITDASRYGEARTLALLEQALRAGARLVQVREKHLGADALARFAHRVAALCRAHGARVLLNGEPAAAQALALDGVHLDSRRLRALDRRPLPGGAWVAASCHSAAELERAARIGADFAVLSPVHPSASHPGARPLGWEGFGRLCAAARLPVYALGGVQPQDLEAARAAGAQGLAMIRGIWEARSVREAVARVGRE